jgi:hypothetical protein
MRSTGPGGGEHRRGERTSEKANHRLRRTPRPAEQGLEAHSRAGGSRATGERVRDQGQGGTAGDESARLRVGTKTLNGNPGRGCGMKQAREAGSGASRREVEKACGRNAAGGWDPPRTWTLPVMPRRGKKPQGRTAPNGKAAQEGRQRHSEEDMAHEGMNPTRESRGTVGMEKRPGRRKGASRRTAGTR